MEKVTKLDLKKESERIRKKVIEYHTKTGKGHIGSSLSSVEIMTTLYKGVMKKEDRFILSKGHASSILYVLLNDLGILPDDKLDSLDVHPKFNQEYGIHASTGSLGHGLSIGLGIALANKDRNVYVLLGDGECEEGQIWEAVRDTAECNTRNLTAIVDCNKFQGFKQSNFRKLDRKFSGFDWDYSWCDGHDCKELLFKFNSYHKRPHVILAETIKGKGISKIENKLESHYYHIK